MKSRKSGEIANVRKSLIEAKEKLKQLNSKPSFKKKIALSEVTKCRRSKMKKSSQDKLLSKFSSFIPTIQENQISVIKGSKKFSGAFGLFLFVKSIIL